MVLISTSKGALMQGRNGLHHQYLIYQDQNKKLNMIWVKYTNSRN